MDLPLFIPRYIVRKMVNQAYEAGKLFQAKEDVRAIDLALREVVPPPGALLREDGSGDLRRSR